MILYVWLFNWRIAQWARRAYRHFVHHHIINSTYIFLSMHRNLIIMPRVEEPWQKVNTEKYGWCIKIAEYRQRSRLSGELVRGVIVNQKVLRSGGGQNDYDEAALQMFTEEGWILSSFFHSFPLTYGSLSSQLPQKHYGGPVWYFMSLIDVNQSE